MGAALSSMAGLAMSQSPIMSAVNGLTGGGLIPNNPFAGAAGNMGIGGGGMAGAGAPVGAEGLAAMTPPPVPGYIDPMVNAVNAPKAPPVQTPQAVVQTRSPEAYRNAIASIESAGSGDYSAIGPTHPTLGRALGRYQIMEANLKPWGQEVFGRPITADEFINNPAIQDALFDAKFGQYVQRFGEEGAAQAWIGGEKGVGKTGRKDSLGTSVGSYGQKFMAALNQPQGVQTGAPQTGQQQGITPTAGQPGYNPSTLERVFMAAYGSPEQQQAAAGQQGPGERLATSVLQRIGKGQPMQPAQAQPSQDAVDTGLQEIAQTAEGLRQQSAAPRMSALERKKALMQRMRGSA